MTSTPASKRTLAAIVFTDVAGFTMLVEADEDHTLDLVARDLEFIRQMCSRHGGGVIKTTGDGLLMHFDSAVEAVACAVKVQETFAKFAQKHPPAEVLHHRIGIHLGDVFISQQDVMGEGVNVAARLQDHAPPGGICISQTVYDVVKNRLRLQATFLGPRELKNIKEAVPIYQIIMNAQAGQSKVGRFAWWQPWHAMASGAGVAVVLMAVWLLWPSGKSEHGPAAHNGPDQGRQSAKAKPRDAIKPPPQSRPGHTPEMDTPEYQKEMNDVLRSALMKHDFNAAVKWLSEHGQADSPRCRAYREMGALGTFMKDSIAKYSTEKPLVIPVPPAMGDDAQRRADVRIWPVAGGRVHIEGVRGSAERSLSELDPGLTARVLSWLLRVRPEATPAVRSAVHAYIDEAQAMGIIPDRRENRRPRMGGDLRPDGQGDGNQTPPPSDEGGSPP